MSVTAQSETRNVDRILAFTRDAISAEVKDQAFNNSPLVACYTGRLLGDFGRSPMTGRAKRVQNGGESIVVRMNLGKNTGVKVKTGPWDTNNTAPSDTVRYSRANWKFYSVPITLSYHDLRVNTGPEAISSLVKFETKNAMDSLVDQIAGDLYDNSGNSNAVTDLDTIISANDSVQGLSGSTYQYFNSRGVSARGTAVASISFAGGAFSSIGLARWRSAWNNASEGTMQPEALFTTWDVYSFYEASLQAQERFTNNKVADGGFMNLQFKSAPVFPDDKCPSGYTYFLNFDSVELVALAGADFNMGEFIEVQNQSAHVSQIEFTGQHVVKARKFLNKTTSQTA